MSIRDKSVYLAKAPVPASEFLRIPGHILNKPNIKYMPRAMLLHTRSATQGAPENNQNNHPLYAKASGLCLIHNGWFTNDDALAEEHKLNMDAQVDSEVYLRLIEKYYLEHPDEQIEAGITYATSEVFGSLACAMIQAGRPGTMWLWKDTGPLMIARTDWGMVFASTKDALLSALMGSCCSFDLTEMLVFEPKVGTLLTFQANGKIGLHKVSAADWHSIPARFTNRVYRTFVGSNLTSVRRARDNKGTTARYQGQGQGHSQSPMDADSEYFHSELGWYYGQQYKERVNHANNDNSANGNSSSPGRNIVTYRGNHRIPEFSGNGATPSYHGAAPGTKNQGGNQGWQENWCQNYNLNKETTTLPIVSYADRCAIHLLKGTAPDKPTDCFCRTDYCCMRCGHLRQYYGISIDELPAIAREVAEAKATLDRTTVKGE